MTDRRSLTVSPLATTLPSGQGLGARVRLLRARRGITQGELAGGRFSNEYISQIERGKTRPTPETLAFLADRLGVAPGELEGGVSVEELERMACVVADAEREVAAHRYGEATELLAGLAIPEDVLDLRFRALLAESWARMELGELQEAVALLEHARSLAEDLPFGDVELADCLYRLGCCRYKLTAVASAQALFDEALELAERSEVSCDRLRSHILEWRSRCYRRQRDWELAREDIERALELAEGLNDDETVAHVTFQASLVAERTGQWVRARSLAERAKVAYEAVDDRRNVGRLLNNLGGLEFSLGRTERAVASLKEAFSIFLELGSDLDAAYAVSSLAQVHLRIGETTLAEEQARHALRLLDGRVEVLDEIGNAQLVLGRALLEQDRIEEADEVFATAERSLTQLSSASHSALAWTAQGDLAERRGDAKAAAALFRRAAESLQDVRF